MCCLGDQIIFSWCHAIINYSSYKVTNLLGADICQLFSVSCQYGHSASKYQSTRSSPTRRVTMYVHFRCIDKDTDHILRTSPKANESHLPTNCDSPPQLLLFSVKKDVGAWRARGLSRPLRCGGGRGGASLLHSHSPQSSRTAAGTTHSIMSFPIDTLLGLCFGKEST